MEWQQYRGEIKKKGEKEAREGLCALIQLVGPDISASVHAD